MAIGMILAPSIPDSFQKRLRLFDRNLKAIFNCETERFEIWRYAEKTGRWNWIIAVENDDESFRKLDERIFRKLFQMDIIARWGSIANYERHLDEKQKNWQNEKQKKMDYELKYDLKDDRKLWQMAAENARSGVFNNPPIQKDRKIISYQK